MYAARFKGALEVAQFLSRNHEPFCDGYWPGRKSSSGSSSLPVWLREALVNILYLFPVNSLWAQGKAADRSMVRSQAGACLA